ncbi:MAG: PilW family protein [Candidatus Saccharibacteria bacterium]
MIMRTRKLTGDSTGFTIVELLISTLIFSVILLIVTVGIIQITRVYYKGLTESSTQNTARTIMDTIAQGIQFSGSAVSNTVPSTPGTATSFCIGTQQFSYRLGYQLVDSSPGTDQTTQALWQSTLPGCSGNPAASVSGKEFLGTHMRLSNLTVTNLSGTLWKVSVTVVYGDDVLLNNPTSTSPTCKGAEAGQQFCSISTLTTTIDQRVTSN